MPKLYRVLLLSFMIPWATGCASDSAGVEGDVVTLFTPDSEIPDTSATVDATQQAPACDPSIFEGAVSLEGHAYLDNNGSDYSIYLSGFESGLDEAAVGYQASAFGPQGAVDTTSCDDGRFGFTGLADGLYHVSLALDSGEYTNTKNHTRQVQVALNEGSMKVVTFGDSVPVQGTPPMFPDRIAQKLSSLVSVDNKNVAIGGTISTDWLPGTNNFEQVLVPHLADADVVIISLGGNDVMGYASTAMSNPAGITGAVDGLNDFLLSVMDNVMAIVAEIRSHNPNVDIVYCLYPNYATSDMWTSVIPAMFLSIVEDLVTTGLDLVRVSIPSEQEVILMDLYGASADLDLDDYLYDQLHFNDAGQELYADEILKVLGFVEVQNGQPAMAPAYGLAN